MTPEEQFNSWMWWTLQKIRRISLLALRGEALEWTMQARPIIGTGMPPIEIRQRTFLKIEELGGIKIIDGKKYSDTYGVDLVYTFGLIQPKFDEIYEKYQELNQESAAEKPKQETATILETGVRPTRVIPIKNVRLDNQHYFLEINNGEEILSFKSKKKGEGFEKETKQFKILFQLWDFRRELKGNAVLTKGDFVSLDNLVRGSGSESTEAAYKHIQRLNKRFEKKGIAIEITGENEKYRLIINRA